MTLRGRLFLFVTLLIITSIPGTAVLFAYGQWQTILERTQNSGMRLTRLLAQSISFNRQTPEVMGDLVDEAVLAQANMVAHLIQIANKRGIPATEINRTLQQVAAREDIAEIWVTDRRGHPRFWSLPDLDATAGINSGFTQSPMFQTLLDGGKYSVVTDLLRLDHEGREIYYAGVAMPDRSGIVLIGRQPDRFNESVNRIGLKRLMGSVMAGAPFGTSIDTIRVFADDLRPLAIASLTGVVEATPLNGDERRLLDQAVDTGDTVTHLEDRGIYNALLGLTQMQVVGPVFGSDGLPEGAILVNLSIDMRDNLRKHMVMGGGLTLLLLMLGLILALPFLNRTVQPLARLTIQTHRLAARNFEPDPEMEAELARVSTGRDEVAFLGGALSAMIGRLQVYIADLKETTAAKERIEGELAAARGIQMGLLPHDFPPPATYDLHAVLIPAKAVGGDLYDFFMVDDHHLFFLIGDVTDKGVPAALFMAVVKTLFTSEVKRDYSSLSGIMARVNQVLCQNNPEGMFVTVCIGILDTCTGAVICSDGGHDAPLLLRQGRVDVIDKVGGLALGLFPDVSYREWTIQLASGDGLVIYTDGVSEAYNADNQLFGSSRLRKVLTDLRPDYSAHSVTDTVMNALDAFVGGHPQSDDITLLALRWNAPS